MEVLATDEEVLLFIFGGLTEQGKPTNTLLQVKIFKERIDTETGTCSYNSMVFLRYVRDTSGKAPMARCNHSSILISNNKYMVIYGGRNDSLY